MTKIEYSCESLTFRTNKMSDGSFNSISGLIYEVHYTKDGGHDTQFRK